jgi:hypothetical protein
MGTISHHSSVHGFNFHWFWFLICSLFIISNAFLILFNWLCRNCKQNLTLILTLTDWLNQFPKARPFQRVSLLLEVKRDKKCYHAAVQFFIQYQFHHRNAVAQEHLFSQSQRYFTTADLPPINSSWRQVPWDSWPVILFSNWTLAVTALM